MSAPSPAASALAGLGKANPEWRAWLARLEETLRTLPDPAWRQAADEPPPTGGDDTPILTEAVLSVDAGALRRYVARLMSATTDGPAGTLKAIAEKAAPADLVEAAVCRDHPRLEDLAASVGAEPGPLHAVVPLLAMPLLHAAARAWAARVRATWDRGYCPVCGAWPTMAEARGLEGTRRLRCGLCGSDWGAGWLRCPFCRTDDHNQLGALVSEAIGPTRKLDVCFSCGGYLKTVTVLTARPADEIPVADLETVDLDLAAIAQGFSRPAEPGYRLRATIVPRRHAGRAVFDAFRRRS